MYKNETYIFFYHLFIQKHTNFVKNYYVNTHN